VTLTKRDQDFQLDPRKELRAQKRTSLKLRGRLFKPNKDYEEACLVLDLSPNGAGLKSACAAPLGSHVILHIDDLGRFEGAIIRRNRLYVGVQFKYSKSVRERIAGRIAGYLEHGTRVYTPMRNSGRFAVADLTHSFAQESGQIQPCEIVDIALSGASVKANARPAIGERVLFGKNAAVVVRHTDVGFAVAFLHSGV
jgi:PilZ domain